MYMEMIAPSENVNVKFNTTVHDILFNFTLTCSLGAVIHT